MVSLNLKEKAESVLELALEKMKIKLTNDEELSKGDIELIKVLLETKQINDKPSMDTIASLNIDQLGEDL